MTEVVEDLQDREKIPESDKWNVEALFSTFQDWEKQLKVVCRPEQKPHWPEIAAFKGKLGNGPSVLKKFFETTLNLERQLSKFHTYAHMRYDEDLAHEQHKKANTIILTLYHDFGQEVSWVEPEILALSDETIQKYLQSEELREYRFYLEKIVRMKPYTLSSDKEELLAMSGRALNSSSNAFSAFNNADLKFPPAMDKEGNLKEVTHGKYSLYLKEKDRELRKTAFVSMHKTFAGFENTVCELFNGQMQKHVFNVRARGYNSCLEAALFPNQIEPSVYKNLISTVRENLPSLHRYMALRKKLLKIDELHMYDLYVPVVDEVELNYNYETAESMVVDSVAPLGEEYQKILDNGLKNDRWVDRYENQRKRSGAYSTGSYDTMPYILMNFHGTFRDLSTLAHEAGHSMHSYYSHKNQPYQYSHYPIFLAEVASTFNEELMFHYLMQQDLSDQERAYLINQKIEDIRATFYRQTMFAEFELATHQFAERDIPLTPGLLKEQFRQLNIDYFGPEVVIDKEIDIEWARIPHFYYNFYVYQYATGISAAHSLFEKVMKEGEAARDKYLKFLSSGSHKYPLDLLAEAGVNMREKQPIEATIQQFDRLVDELSKLL